MTLGAVPEMFMKYAKNPLEHLMLFYLWELLELPFGAKFTAQFLDCLTALHSE
jgi:hypothetical protein